MADHVYVAVKPAEGPPPSFAAVLGGVDGTLKATGVSHLEIDSLTLTRQGAAVGDDPMLDRVAVSAEAEGDEVSATLAGNGVRGTWSITAAIASGSTPGERVMTIGTRGLDMADLAMMGGDSAPTLSGPLSIEGRGTLSSTGEVHGAVGDVTLGPVSLRDGGEEPILPEPSRLKLEFDAAAGALSIQPSTVMLPGGHALVQGRVTVPDSDDARWRFTLAASGEEAGADGRQGSASSPGPTIPRPISSSWTPSPWKARARASRPPCA